MAKLKPDVIEWILKLNSDQAQEAFHKLEKETRSLQASQNAARKTMAELEKQGHKGSQEWVNLKKSVAEYGKEISTKKTMMAEISKQFDLTGMTVAQLRNHLKNLKREFENTSKSTHPDKYKELQAQIEKTNNALVEAKNGASRLKAEFTKLRGLKDAVQGFFLGIGNAIFQNFVGAFKNAFSIIVDFEKENSKLAAILGSTKEGISEMTKAARDLGGSTSYSAAQVTQLQIELAKLGFSKQQILDMEESVLKFAKAVDTDLASASAFTGAALRIFGKDAREAESTLATLAIATTKTALDFSMLETALSTVGPVATAAGFSLEDTTALLGQLANAGFDASTAATSTRNIILKMVDPAGKLAQALGGPCKSAEDLAAGFKALQEKGVDLATALELTDKRSVATFQTFLEQSGTLVELKNSITGVDDAFNAMYGTMADNVSGALAGLKSASEELMLTLADGTESALKGLIQGLTTMVNWLKSGVEWVKENSRWIKTLIATFVGLKVGLIAVNAIKKIWIGLVRTSGAEIAALTVKEKANAVAKGLMTKATTALNTSMKALKATLTSVSGIVGIVTTVITTAVSAFIAWKSAGEEVNEIEREAAERTAEHAKSREELEVKIETEKKRLLELHAIAQDELEDHDKRLSAVNELNRVIPEYAGWIDSTTGALRANTTALKENIREMEKRARLQYYKEEYQKYIREETAAELAWKRAERENNRFKENETVVENGRTVPKDEVLRRGYYGRMTFKEAWNYGDDLEDWKKRKKELAGNETAARYSYIQTIAGKNAFLKDVESTGTKLSELFSTEESSDTTEIFPRTPIVPTGGSGRGSNRNSEPKKDPIKEATRSANVRHQEELAKIEEGKADISDADYAIKKADELLRYAGDLKEALKTLKESTKETDTELLDKIAEREAKISQEEAKAREAIDAANMAKAEKKHADRLSELQTAYDAQEYLIAERLQKQETTQEAADITLMAMDKKLHEDQLAELNRYYKEVESAEYIGEQERKERLEELSADIRATQRQILTDSGKFSAKLRDMMTNPFGPGAAKANYDSRVQAINSEYDEMLKHVEAGSAEAVALEEEKNRRLLVLNYQYQEELLDLKENAGLSWADEYDRELLRLEEMHAQGIISEKEYQAKRLQIMSEQAKKYFDYYAGLSATMFQSIQDAEIAMSDAKYDALIRQAENNGEDTAELEQEKENKKLEIQKKYADVNFAIKISQIIADTAVAIMKAYSELGWIGGTVAAVMLAATGAAQIASANAEREKIKNLQPSTSAGKSQSSSPATATRALTGYSEGGYTGDGDRYEVAGLVHKGEYVVPKPIMSNPRVVDAVGTIEAIRLSRRGNVAGYADGGFTASPAAAMMVAPGNLTQELSAEIRTMLAEMRTIFRNVKAYVVLQDLEKKQKQLDDARSPFKR